MESSAPCPFRYIYKGRTFCAIAIRERKYTTTEVVPSACVGCHAREILLKVACGRLNLGVEVDQYGGSHDVGLFYASCEKSTERLTVFDKCGDGVCPDWVPLDQDRLEATREEALAAQRDADGRDLD